MRHEIAEILDTTDNSFITAWSIFSPRIFYKDLAPYGMVATEPLDDFLAVMAFVKEGGRLTMGMKKYIVSMYRNNSVMFMFHDDKVNEPVVELLTDHDFVFNRQYGSIMAYHILEKEE